MPRTMLNDEQWTKLYTILLETSRIYNKKDHRKTFEGILYRMRAGCPWRDLPEYFGDWCAIFRRFNLWLWSKKGILLQLFNSLAKEPDTEWEFIDGSIIKAHQHSAGATSASSEAIGKSRGGLTTKIHMAVDSYGLPIHFMLSDGEVHDSKVAESLIDAFFRSHSFNCYNFPLI